MGSLVLGSRRWATTLYFLQALQSGFPATLAGVGASQAYSPPLTDAEPTAWKACALPKAPSLPCCCPGNSGCWEEGQMVTLETTSGRAQRLSPSHPPRRPGERRKIGPIAFQKAFFL